MTTVLCLAPYRGSVCQQILFKIESDFTGSVEIKCPHCRAITVRRSTAGRQDVA